MYASKEETAKRCDELKNVINRMPEIQAGWQKNYKQNEIVFNEAEIYLKKTESNFKEAEAIFKQAEADFKQAEKNFKVSKENLDSTLKEHKFIEDSHATFCTHTKNDLMARLQRLLMSAPIMNRGSTPITQPNIVYDENALNSAKENLQSKNLKKIDSSKIRENQIYYVNGMSGNITLFQNGNYVDAKVTLPVFAKYVGKSNDGRNFGTFNVYDSNGKLIFDRTQSHPSITIIEYPYETYRFDTANLDFYPVQDVFPISSTGGNKRKTRSSNKTSKRRVKTKSHRRRNNISRRRKQRR
jgi:hypothetical protein